MPFEPRDSTNRFILLNSEQVTILTTQGIADSRWELRKLGIYDLELIDESRSLKPATYGPLGGRYSEDC